MGKVNFGGKYLAYPGYKESGSEWVDEIPSDWKVVSLKHILSIPITDGPHLTPEFLDEGVPFVSAEAVSGGYIDFDKIRGFISESDHALFSQKYSPQLYDVFMVKSGATTGISAIVETNRRFNIWSPLAVMRCRDFYHPYFLLNYLRSDSFQKSVQLSWTFGTQQNIGMGTLGNLTVSLPSFDEQQKIANFLDHETAKIDTLIEKQQQLIKLLKEKRQAVISHAVTKGLNPNAPMKDSGVEWLGEVPEHWVVAKVKYFATIQGGYAFSSDSFLESGVQLLRIGNVYLNRLALERQPTFVDESFVKSHKEFSVRRGDILMSLTGTLGKTDYGFAVHVDEKGPFMLNQRVAKITPIEAKIAADYLIYAIRSDSYLKRLYSLPSGTKQANLANDDVTNIPIVVPQSMEEQLVIARYISGSLKRYGYLISKSETAIELIQERRTALISAAVTGKIDVRNWEST